jgi:RHS repeat-associated protein
MNESVPSKPYALSEINRRYIIIPNAVDSLIYTSFECVKTIQEDPYSASFVYNADNGRAKMEVKQNATTILTRWYSESSYIKETAGGTTKEYTFIGGDPYNAPIVAITQSGTTTYFYLLRDHLGSITHVVDASSGTLSYQYSYDAWGRMRTYSGWVNYNPGSEPALFIAGRGFTGHEHLPWFNLINMNGRMYDPIAGQFLSPDNNIQDAYNSQNLNRYSYCLNNPLKYSDPTGKNYERDPSIIGLSAHEQIYGPNSHIDELWRERFGLMYNDVFQSGGPNNSQPQENTEEIKLIDIFGNEVTFLIPKISTITIDNTKEAFIHYFNGDGAPVTLGPSSISAIWNSEEFQLRHSRIVTGQTTRLIGDFGVNMEGLVFHIGKTNVDYAINCSIGNCTVTYDLFVTFPNPGY